MSLKSLKCQSPQTSPSCRGQRQRWCCQRETAASPLAFKCSSPQAQTSWRSERQGCNRRRPRTSRKLQAVDTRTSQHDQVAASAIAATETTSCDDPVAECPDTASTDIENADSAEHVGLEGLEAKAEVILPTLKLILPVEAVHTGRNLPSPEIEQSSASEEVQESPQPQHTRRVRFDDAATTVHEIVPCSEIYGVHPREFVFEKDYSMVPAVGFADIATAWKRHQGVADDEDCDNDTDEFAVDDWDEEYCI